MPARELQLVAVGSIPSTVMTDIADSIQTILGVGAWPGKQALPKPQYAFNKERGQYHCNAIMRRLLTVREAGATLLLGVCDVDLFVPDSPFVYGEADRESKTGIFSATRLKTEGEVFKKRVQAQGAHEAGHLIGLSYCEDVRCLMFFATSLADCDRRQLQLCNNCRNELHKLRR